MEQVKYALFEEWTHVRQDSHNGSGLRLLSTQRHSYDFPPTHAALDVSPVIRANNLGGKGAYRSVSLANSRL